MLSYQQPAFQKGLGESLIGYVYNSVDDNDTAHHFYKHLHNTIECIQPGINLFSVKLKEFNEVNGGEPLKLYIRIL